MSTTDLLWVAAIAALVLTPMTIWSAIRWNRAWKLDKVNAAFAWGSVAFLSFELNGLALFTLTQPWLRNC